VLGTSNITFNWTPGTGVTQYQLYLSTTAGTYSLYKSGGVNTTSVTVPTLPSAGATVYATLLSNLNGAWQTTTATYTESPGVPATITTPVSGAVLGTSNITFNWTPGADVARYQLYLGTTPGAYNLYKSSVVNTTSATAPTLPTKGAAVYATLLSEINGVWQTTTATYTESPGVPATFIAPASGAALGTSNVTFNWTQGVGVTQYELYLSSKPGTYSLYKSGMVNTTSVTVPTLPSSGITVYATLWSNVNGAWQTTTATYTESPGVPATITTPVSGSVLGTSNITFNWTPGTGVTQYELYLSTKPGTYSLYRSGVVNTTSVTVPTLPASGATVYATLLSNLNGAWQTTTATYTVQK
jgi:hypothetical protein